MKNFLELDNISISAQSQIVFDRMSYSFDQSKTYGIIGNGATGKTTLLKIISGYLPYNKGTVSINGKILGKEIDFFPDAGILIRPFGFLPQFNGVDNLKYITAIKGKAGIKKIESLLCKYIGSEFLKTFICDYSESMIEKLAFIQSIIDDPSTLILDEPFSGLDNHGQAMVQESLKAKKREGNTIFISSKGCDELKNICDEFLFLNNGNLIKRNV